MSIPKGFDDLNGYLWFGTGIYGFERVFGCHSWKGKRQQNDALANGLRTFFERVLNGYAFERVRVSQKCCLFGMVRTGLKGSEWVWTALNGNLSVTPKTHSSWPKNQWILICQTNSLVWGLAGTPKSSQTSCLFLTFCFFTFHYKRYKYMISLVFLGPLGAMTSKHLASASQEPPSMLRRPSSTARCGWRTAARPRAQLLGLGKTGKRPGGFAAFASFWCSWNGFWYGSRVFLWVNHFFIETWDFFIPKEETKLSAHPFGVTREPYLSQGHHCEGHRPDELLVFYGCLHCLPNHNCRSFVV